MALLSASKFQWDEHGSMPSRPYLRGKKRTVTSLEILDYVAPSPAKAAPYLDMGGWGLALVAMHSYTVYKDYSPSMATVFYLVGRNETGTSFAHAVSCKISHSVRAAVRWLWNDLPVIERAGDVGISPGARRERYLPPGHKLIQDGANWVIRHTPGQHADLVVPPQHRIVVARRKAVTAAALPWSTHD